MIFQNSVLARANRKHGWEPNCVLLTLAATVLQVCDSHILLVACHFRYKSLPIFGHMHASGTLALVLSYLVESGIREIVAAPRKARKMEDHVEPAVIFVEGPHVFLRRLGCSIELQIASDTVNRR